MIVPVMCSHLEELDDVLHNTVDDDWTCDAEGGRVNESTVLSTAENECFDVTDRDDGGGIRCPSPSDNPLLPLSPLSDPSCTRAATPSAPAVA